MSTVALGDLSPVVLAGVLLLLAFTRLWRIRAAGLTALRAAGMLGWCAVAGGLVWIASQSVASALPPAASGPGNPCNAGQTPRTFNVSLINIPLFLNRFGDVVPEGRMYVLDEDIATVRATFATAAKPQLAGEKDLLEPLTLRANKGDCVQVRFTNRLNEPAPNFVRNDSIFTLPGETLRPAGTVTPAPREFAPALTQPDNDFDPARAPRASMHVDGLDYDVTGSDGAAVGNNPDSTAAPGAAITYRFYAQVEGEFQFKDGADPTSRLTQPDSAAAQFIGSQSFGAFGAFVVEPPGATWVDARTGGELKSGTRAIIKQPNAPDFREHVLFMHDEVEAEPGILTRLCRTGGDEGDPDNCVNPTAAQLAKLKAGTLPGLSGGDADALVNGEIPVKLEYFAFNYRSEPGFNREEVGCPAATKAGQGFDAAECIGEETSLSSWAFGDPGGGDLVFANYRGEPTEVRLLHPAEAETHTFHWHVNRWPFDPNDEGGLAAVSDPNHSTAITNPLDVQAVSPGSHYGLIVEGGAGSAFRDKPATFGDIIFHCHLYPHFATGMWGLNRTLDKREDGDRTNPDGTPIPRLEPLADFDYDKSTSGTNPPPDPSPTKPGYPLFLPGKFGFKAPKPPLGVPQRAAAGVFPPTQLEEDAADPGAQVPGGFFQNPCPAGQPVKTFNVAAIELTQVYNPKLNWKNPQSRIYVRQEDKAAVLGGSKPEPFSPLLNVGDCVVYNLTNELPEQFGGTVFDRAQVTNEVGIHQHMVQFDVLSSDGAANGWNYDQGADPSQTITYRNFVHSNTATNSFHDHFFPNVHQDNGLFGGSSIHDAGCTFHDPKSGAVVQVGTIVDIRCTATTDFRGQFTSGQDYRNVSLFVEDHVPMFQPANAGTPNDDQFVTPDGVPVYPAKFPSSTDDQGVMGVNYRLEPFEARRNADPSLLFDSDTHGDPFTPIPAAFPGDRVRWRLFQLSQEESHGFNLDDRWKFEPNDPQSTTISAQHIGMLEYFDVQVPTHREGLKIITNKAIDRDHMYNFGGADDWFLGAWGLFRVFTCSSWPPLGSGLPPTTTLRPLPDNLLGPLPCLQGDPPPPTQPAPGNPCPPLIAPLKKYTVVAFNKDITYNDAGDHDPNGLMYALEADVAAIKAGTKPAEPLVIRANAGDCIEVTLKNQLDPALMTPHCFESLEPGQLGFKEGVLTFPACVDQPPKNEVNVPGFQPFPVSARVSLRPQLVNYWSLSAGSHVGYSADTTVGPGQQILYRWYAPLGVTGMALLEDRADVQNHRHHGLYGALVIEPALSTYKNPKTGQPLTSGGQAVVVNPIAPDFRENIVLFNSDLSLFRADGQPVPDNVDLELGPSREADDPEDQGEYSIGYRNEPFSHRYADNDNLTYIFSNDPHGDPATPLFESYGGDNVWFRVGQSGGDPRSTGFTLYDHVWRRSAHDPQSQVAASQGQFNPGSVYDIQLNPAVFGGAGGRRGKAGDYLYRSTVLPRILPGGQWGIFRVHATGRANLIALPDHPVSGAPTPIVEPAPAPTEPEPVPGPDQPVASIATRTATTAFRRRR